MIDPESGFTLLEVVCVIAIMGFIAAIAIPMLPRGTSRSRLEAYAMETAAVLKADRNAAIRRRSETTTRGERQVSNRPLRFDRSRGPVAEQTLDLTLCWPSAANGVLPALLFISSCPECHVAGLLRCPGQELATRSALIG